MPATSLAPAPDLAAWPPDAGPPGTWPAGEHPGQADIGQPTATLPPMEARAAWPVIGPAPGTIKIEYKYPVEPPAPEETHIPPDEYDPDNMVLVSHEPEPQVEPAYRLPNPKDEVLAYDAALVDGQLPSPAQVREIRTLLGYYDGASGAGQVFGDIALGPEVNHRLHVYAGRGMWIEDPVDASSIARVFGDAAHILRRRDASDHPGASKLAERVIRLPEGFSEDDLLVMAQGILRGKFGVAEAGVSDVQFTPSNLDNAVALVWEALEDFTLLRGSKSRPVGVRPVTTKISRTPDDIDPLLWLVEQRANPSDVSGLLHPRQSFGGTIGPWGAQHRKLTESQERRVAQLTGQLKTIDGYRRRISKGGPVPQQEQIMDDLFGRRRKLTAADTELTNGIRRRLLDMAATPDRGVKMRHHREDLARWGRRRRGDPDEYYGGEIRTDLPGGGFYIEYVQLDTPRRGIISRIAGNTAVWLATKAGYGREEGVPQSQLRAELFSPAVAMRHVVPETI